MTGVELTSVSTVIIKARKRNRLRLIMRRSKLRKARKEEKAGGVKR